MTQRLVIPGRELYDVLASPYAPADPVPRRPPPLRSYGVGTKWREQYEQGVARSRSRLLGVETRRRSALAEVERRRLIIEIAELAVWWDGPGSEGRRV